MSAPPIADRLAGRLTWEEIDPAAMRDLIRLAREEDLEGRGLARAPARKGDITSDLLPVRPEAARARLVAREAMTICGLPLVPMVLEAYGPETAFEPAAADGNTCQPGTALGTITGPARTLLQAERVLLNFLQRLSGVASTTREYVEALGSSPTRLLDTRKTTPGLRVLEKYAVACGRGFNHRMGLFDRIMLKDNHLAAAGARSGEALAALVRSCRQKWPYVVVELEVDSLDQIPPALDAGIEILLLDNFTLTGLREAIALVGDRAATEASGCITLGRIPELGAIGLDFISTGATVHQATWRDVGLDWD